MSSINIVQRTCHNLAHGKLIAWNVLIAAYLLVENGEDLVRTEETMIMMARKRWAMNKDAVSDTVLTTTVASKGRADDRSSSLTNFKGQFDYTF